MRLSTISVSRPSAKALLKLTAVAGIAALSFQTVPALAQSFTVNSVVIEGNERIETSSILSYLGIGQGQTVSASELNDASQRIRATGLFETVDIVPEGGRLVIQVKEFPTVYRINFEGNARLKDDELFPLISSVERRIYSPTQVEADVAAVTKAYADKGRINVVVTPRIIRLSENRVNLVFEVNESGVTEIESIGFAGNRSFTDRRLRGVLATKQAGVLRALIGRDTFVADRLEFDKQVLTDFYQSHGYVDFQVQDVNVELTRGRDAYLITFNVVEGQQFTFGAVTVSSDLPEVDVAAFQNVVRTKEGSVYTPVDIENDISRMENLALAQGLQFIKIDPQITRDDRGQVLAVNYALSRGERIFVERIDIEGNNTTLDRVVRQQFRVVEGDPFNPRSIRQSAERIRALGYFSNADVQTRPGTTPDQVVIDVNVTEAPTGSLTFGANYNTDTGFGLIASYRQSNFMGRGQNLDLQLSTASTNKYLSLNFVEPYLLGRDLKFGFEFDYGATNKESANYNTESFTLKPSLTFEVSENGRLQTYVQSRYSDLTDPADDLSPVLTAEVDMDGVWTQSAGYSYTWDSRRGGIDENRGILFRVGQEYAFGDTSFVKSTATLSGETKVGGGDVTLRASVNGGLLHYLEGDSRISDRFFLTSRQMHGFDLRGMGPRYVDDTNGYNDSLGGNAYAVATLEAEFPIGLPEEYGIHGGAFLDYGSLWDPGYDAECDNGEILYCDFTPRSVVGVSLYWSTPIGPLRFDWSTALDSEEYDETKSFDVSVSTSF